MAERLVQCVKLKRELPGLDHPPFSGELGERIYQNVSQEAWAMYREHLKMVINEYRLTPIEPAARKFLEEQMESFFFGGGSSKPEGYRPPSE